MRPARRQERGNATPRFTEAGGQVAEHVSGPRNEECDVRGRLVAVAGVAFPGDRETPVIAKRQPLHTGRRGQRLLASGHTIDPLVAGERLAVGVEAPHEYVRVVAAIGVCVPGHHELSAGRHCDRGTALRTGGVAHRQRLGGQWIAVGVEAADHHVVVSRLVQAHPGDRVASAIVGRDRGLDGGGSRLAHANRVGDQSGFGIETSGIDAVELIAVIDAGPSRDKAAFSRRRDAGEAIVTVRRRVEKDLLGEKITVVG